MNRRIILLKLFLKKNGFERANYIKKCKLFKNIGDHCYYHPYIIPAEANLVSFGNNVIISKGVELVTHDMSYSLLKNDSELQNTIGQYNTFYYTDGITIGNNVMVGLNSIILPGVKIGNNVIIGAGSVVSKNIPSGEIWAGVPAKKIGNYFDFAKKRVLIENLEDMKN